MTRSLKSVLLLLVAVAVADARRKSLSFGPVLPNSRFHVDPPQQPAALASASSAADPHAVARAYLDGLLGPDAQYYIRKDSYTDDATGVSHIYARQLLNGIEVADGNINLNIKDGQVLSFGDSFYRGPTPAMAINPADELNLVPPHLEHCYTLADELLRRQLLLAELQSSSQLPLASLKDDIFDTIDHLHDSNCAALQTLAATAHTRASTGSSIVDPREAALYFMIAATPSTTLPLHIQANFEQYLAGINTTPVHHLVGSHDTLVEMLDNVPDAVSPVKAKLTYVQVPHEQSTALHLAWKLEVEMTDNWYEAYVSATQHAQIVLVIDWASDAPIPKPDPRPESATYRVFNWGINDPSVGNRSVQTELGDSLASPLGWHSFPAGNLPSGQLWSRLRGSLRPSDLVNFTTTIGNNVFAHENWEGRSNWLNNYRPDAGNSLEFDYTYDPKVANDSMTEARKYINATITQLFYTSNMVHDLFYRYGFDERSGNFQQHNFGRGGEENDAVIANAQDGSGMNNANFMTPPDGQNGRCRMFLWNTASPYRDGDLEAGIVIHELAHGLSTRLTGGPADSGCLGWGESGGMGEGWGDFLATTIRSTANYSDYAMGAWAANQEKGIRNYVYSTNMTINPSVYKTLDKPGYWGVHATGEVWAEMLWIVSQKLITKHGYSDTLFPPSPLPNGTIPVGEFYREPEEEIVVKNGKVERRMKPLVPKHGNSLVVQLVLNGMKLQPCRPSFFEARDAIIQADKILTGGENLCLIWEGFSERGLGPKAKVEGRTPWGGGIRTNDMSLPAACRGSKTPDDDDDDDGDKQPDEDSFLRALFEAEGMDCMGDY